MPSDEAATNDNNTEMLGHLASSAVRGSGRLRRRLGWVAGTFLAFLGGIALLLRYGGEALVTEEPLPTHAQVAVMLDGSLEGVVARRAEVMALLGEGKVDHALLSVPVSTYWGESVPEVARRFLEARYGAALAERVTFCPNVTDSTAEEAEVLRSCLEQQGWRSIVVVTSNYHTRRARIVWRDTLAKATPPFTLSVHGVFDGDFHPRGWWRERISAKTWLLEVTKLGWILVLGTRVWR